MSSDPLAGLSAVRLGYEANSLYLKLGHLIYFIQPSQVTDTYITYYM